MKATVKISVMLMAMIVGTLAASAQSARRGSTGTQERTSSARVDSRTSKSQVQQRHSSKSNAAKRPRVQQPTSRNRDLVQNRTNTQRKQTYRQPVNRNNISRSSREVRQNVSNQRKVTYNDRNNNSHSRFNNNIRNGGKTLKDPRSSVENRNRNHNSRTTHVVAHRDYRHVRHNYHYPTKKVRIHVHPATYHHHYRVRYYPAYRDIVWTRKMHRYYVEMYPGYMWHYPVGYRIQTISAFDAKFNVGEVARVYGRVYATWHNREADELFLFFGGQYPNQEFTVILPGRIARRYSWRPERYFLGQHIIADGLITRFEGQPEMIIKKKRQLEIY